MTLFAWESYKKYSWGQNELRPLSKRGYTPAFLRGSDNLGLTIVDSLDTLYLMGFKDEFYLGLKWVRENLFASKIV